MRIEAISPAISSINTQSDIGVAMLSKSLDTVEETGDNMLKMMERSMLENSVNPYVGSNIDISI
jgi:hypothetical protein